MQLKNLFLVNALILIYSVSNAQIGFGFKKIGGDATLNYNHLYEDFFDPSKESASAALNPTLGTFAGKKTLLTIQPNAKYSTTLGNSRYNYLEQITSSLGLNVSLRHYIDPDAKWKFYGEIMGGVFEKTLVDYSGNKYSRNIKDVGVLIGANKFLNNSMSLNFQLGCDFLFEDRYFLNTTTSNYFLGLNFENFIKTDTKEEDSILIAKGRKTIDGNIRFNYYVYEETTFALDFVVKYGQLITSKLMVGGVLGISGEESRDKKIDVQLFTRYYFPLTKKLFIYPQAKLLFGQSEFSVSGFYSNSSKNNLYAEGSLGLNYFIKKNVALEVDLLRFSYKSSSATNLRAGASVELRYFLK